MCATQNKTCVISNCVNPVASNEAYCQNHWSQLFHEKNARTGITAPHDPVNHPKHYNDHPSGVDATLAERGKRYGPFNGHAAITQEIKGALKNARLSDGSFPWHTLNASQREALEMIAHKIGRILNGDPNYADSWHDIAGYATLVEKQLVGKND